MKRSPILIVRSHQGRGLSVRPPSGYGEHIGAGLIEAGFQEGDEAVVVLRSELEALLGKGPSRAARGEQVERWNFEREEWAVVGKEELERGDVFRFWLQGDVEWATLVCGGGAGGRRLVGHRNLPNFGWEVAYPEVVKEIDRDSERRTPAGNKP